MEDFTVLKTQADYEAWVESKFNNGGIFLDQVEPPKQYPALGYSRPYDWRYEIRKSEHLYLSDLSPIVKEMYAAYSDRVAKLP